MLSMFNQTKLAESLKIALNQELPKVEEVKRAFKTLPVHQIPDLDTKSMIVATVATDGGENRLILDPVRIQIIRVVDSAGNVYYENFIPLSMDLKSLFESYFESNDQLQLFREELNLEWDDFFPSTDYLRSNLMNMLRELLEWSVILKLMHQDSEPMLVLRDGLLRSVGIPAVVFQALKEKLEQLSKKNKHKVVGVAKRSKVLSYLSLVISMNNSLPMGTTGYIEISEKIETEATPPNYRWASPRSMGKLFLARLSSQTSSIYPVEIPKWNLDDAEGVFAILSADSLISYPDSGYPLSLIKAHQFARIGGLEIIILENMLIEHLREQRPELADHVLRQMMLGKKLSLPLGDDLED